MASSGVSGDWRKLRRLMTQVRRVGTPDFRHRINKQLAEEAISQVMIGFELQQDPYGVPWRPRRLGTGTHPILRKTARMMSSFSTAASPDNFTLFTSTSYMVAHQYGTDHLPRRQMIPLPGIRGGNLGARWTQAFSEILSTMLRRHVG